MSKEADCSQAVLSKQIKFLHVEGGVKVSEKR